jgi:hypothetical protein
MVVRDELDTSPVVMPTASPLTTHMNSLQRFRVGERIRELLRHGTARMILFERHKIDRSTTGQFLNDFVAALVPDDDQPATAPAANKPDAATWLLTIEKAELIMKGLHSDALNFSTTTDVECPHALCSVPCA